MTRFLACVLLLAGLLAGSPVAALAEVRAGAARARFELPARVPLAGYSRRHGKPSEGVHDAVGVQALILRDEDTTLALVSADLLIIDERLFDAVRGRVSAQGLSPEPVLLLAGTHTHSGPGAYGTKFLEKISMGHYDPAVFDAIVRVIADTVVRAAADPAPVRVAYGATATEGLVTNRMVPGGPVDPDLVVVGFSRAGSDRLMAAVTNFAAHPTTLGAWNRLVSADYPGVIARELARRFPESVSLFFAGAVADQAPVKSGDRFERAEAVGRPLAEQASTLLRTVSADTPRDVRALQERMPLPPAQLRLNRWVIPRWLGQRFVDDDATLTVASVGHVLFMGAPCDLASSLGERLNAAARAKGWQPVIVGFANDYIGYCVPETLYEAKQYESSMAFNGSKAGELIVERLLEMMGRLGDR